MVGTFSYSFSVLSRLVWVALLTSMACATNPATGRRQLSLISEEQEIQMGRQAAASVGQTMGFVDDKGLQAYVAQIGQREAALSERPNLPWEFNVVDDPTPNAFALPGGFIYVTRGMLGLMTSEAELAGVLGHEIGHVTGRHSVNQVSKAQLAQLGLGLGSIFAPEVRPYQSLVGTGLDLLFLKYSRDHEREADDLGFRYMHQRGYDVREFDDVFAALGRIGEQGGGLPSWLLTHPAPAERVESAHVRATAMGVTPHGRVGHEDYLAQIDDLVYGKDPRDGFFREHTFYHPKLRFQMTFPDGWQTENLAQAVVGMARDNRAALQLSIVGRARPEAAIKHFFSQPGIAAGRIARAEVSGAPAAIGEFQAQTEEGVVQGLAAYVSRGDVTYQLIGYTAAPLYGDYAVAIERAIRSFGPVNDRGILNVQPQRIDVVKIQTPMTVNEFVQQFGSAVSAETIAIINGVPGPDSRLQSGSLVKRVVGREG